MEKRPLTERVAEHLRFAWQGLRMWGPRQILVAAVAAIVTGLVIGIATVLIPNTWFMRDIPTVWWNYPVWILTSIGAGMLAGTYARPPGRSAADPEPAPSPTDGRSARFGMVGTVLAWFAVGCPVCNKIALLALGYTGALTWFAPVQPVLAIASLAFILIALVWRLRGQVSCVLPERAFASTSEAVS